MPTQVETNYEAFKQQLPKLVAENRGKFALMRAREIVEMFDTARDAFVAGQKMFGSADQFSVQEVIDTPVDLGFYSHALS